MPNTMMFGGYNFDAATQQQRAVSTDRSGEDVVVQQSSMVHHVHDA